MILKRTEKGNIIEALYNSSNIIASSYNKLTNQLQLTFGKGDTYAYDLVNPTDYLRFELAESQGKVFNTHIKKYSYVKLDSVDAQKLITEADSLKAAEAKALLNAKEKALIDYMNVILNDVGTTLTVAGVNTLIKYSNDLLTELNK